MLRLPQLRHGYVATWHDDSLQVHQLLSRLESTSRQHDPNSDQQERSRNLRTSRAGTEALKGVQSVIRIFKPQLGGAEPLSDRTPQHSAQGLLADLAEGRSLVLVCVDGSSNELGDSTWARALRLRDEARSLTPVLSMRCMPGSLAHSDATESSISCGYPSTGLSLGFRSLFRSWGFKMLFGPALHPLVAAEART